MRFRPNLEGGIAVVRPWFDSEKAQSSQSRNIFFALPIAPSLRTVIFPPPGEVSEWSKVPDSKSGVARVTVGSNPTLSDVYLALLTQSIVGS